jgi:hypothetical protein
MQEQILKLNNNCINFNFEGFKRKYEVQISIDGDLDGEISVISYKIEVKYFKKKDSLDYTVEVTTTDFMVNFEYPDSLIQTIALECRVAYEKCIFVVNSKNVIIEFENYENILENWTQAKEKLTQKYDGETFQKYLNLFEEKLFKKDLFFLKIKKNLFINQYFFPIFDTQYNNLKNTTTEFISFFDFDYQEDVIVEIETNADFEESENTIITKKIVESQNNIEFFPIELYETKYTLDKNLSINKIEGQFVNHNKKYGYKINTISN